MKKIILLISLFSILACANGQEIEAKAAVKARYQAETGSRINEASKDVDSLFDEIK
ncbi:MAG: hypothetical protein ACJA02_000483 [Myxococcota bacterium]|jgi:hypothetical protein